MSNQPTSPAFHLTATMIVAAQKQLNHFNYQEQPPDDFDDQGLVMVWCPQCEYDNGAIVKLQRLNGKSICDQCHSVYEKKFCPGVTKPIAVTPFCPDCGSGNAESALITYGHHASGHGLDLTCLDCGSYFVANTTPLEPIPKEGVVVMSSPNEDDTVYSPHVPHKILARVAVVLGGRPDDRGFAVILGEHPDAESKLYSREAIVAYRAADGRPLFNPQLLCAYRKTAGILMPL